MKKIEKKMQDVLNRGEKVLVSGVPVGYPDIDSTRRIVEIYLESGIDVVEFSMPSPDPYIDTKIIADANVNALTLEPELDKYFDVLLKVREDFPDEPFYIMAYADIIRSYGVERFIGTICQAGIDAVELPDKEEIAPDLAGQLDALLEATGIYRTYILQHPFDERYFLSIRNKARGFVLLQSFANRFGKREQVAPENKTIIEKMRQTDLDAMIILGYGINNPERVKEAIEVGADGVIVGTAMIERINQADYTGLSEFIRAMKRATLPTV